MEEQLDIHEAGNFLGVSIDWLAAKRYRRMGPEYMKIGRRVYYTKESL